MCDFDCDMNEWLFLWYWLNECYIFKFKVSQVLLQSLDEWFTSTCSTNKPVCACFTACSILDVWSCMLFNLFCNAHFTSTTLQTILYMIITCITTLRHNCLTQCFTCNYLDQFFELRFYIMIIWIIESLNNWCCSCNI